MAEITQKVPKKKRRTTKIGKELRLRQVDKLIAEKYKPYEIQIKLNISEKTYYRDIKELHRRMYTEESMAQYDKEIQSTWSTLEDINNTDLKKTEDNPVDRAKVMPNSIKINKEKSDYYLKTGKIKDKPQEINLTHKGDLSLDFKVLEKYLKSLEHDNDKP